MQPIYTRQLSDIFFYNNKNKNETKVNSEIHVENA